MDMDYYPDAGLEYRIAEIIQHKGLIKKDHLMDKICKLNAKIKQNQML